MLLYVIDLIIKLIESIVNFGFSKYIFFKQKYNNKFIHSIRSESGPKSIYFFRRLNEIIKENEKEEFIKSLDFVNPYDKDIYQLELKKTTYKDNGKIDSDEIIKRNRMFLKIVMYMSLQELYEWETFLSINESPHSVKEYFREIFYSSVIFSIFGSILSRIHNASLYIYIVYLMMIFISALVLMYFDRASGEKDTEYNLVIIKRAIEIKEKMSKESN